MKEYRIKGHVERKHSNHVIKEFRIQRKYWLGWIDVHIPTMYSDHPCFGLGIVAGSWFFTLNSLEKAQSVLEFLKERKPINHRGHIIKTYLQRDFMEYDHIYIDTKLTYDNGHYYNYAENLDTVKEYIDGLYVKNTETKYYE